MNIHAIYGKMLPLFRRRRMRRFLQVFRPTDKTRILDVGGTPMVWRLIDCPSEITLVNINLPAIANRDQGRFRFVEADALDLPFENFSFDIAFSNSVIEHVHTWKNQQRFALEMRRVARGIWVQTPAKEFFFEPHYLTPILHWLPLRSRRRIARDFSPWGWITRPSKDEIDARLSEIRLLTETEMARLFPDCRIARETFLKMRKSYIAVRE